ncbi:MAG: NADH-quinone oxidoreductase subunit NuoH [Chloroherpetonaceae bacterium]|nr:NADH-quinone oxidoreductase subunit NuoH [Chthonomonadaceae bacterium]MDW8207840.1 NADH-quinone oxidoreductase subunit NuoH [Chloroherpetonaceae bacterium]
MIGQLAIAFPANLGPIYLPALVPYIALVIWLGFVLTILPGLIWIERVVIALMQDRSGPNRVGPRGLLQPTADVIKLFFKEDVLPENVDVRIYYIAPVIAVILAFAACGTLVLDAIPFVDAEGRQFTVPLTVGDVNIGLLYILAMASLQVYGIVLAGWASNNKYSLLGGLRASAQVISYELAMGLALLCAILMAGSLRLGDIVEAQATRLPFPGAPEFLRGSILAWFWLGTGLIPVVLYTIAMVAETNRAPFDLPEAESELIAGFHTEYSSMKFAMFFTSEYVAMLTVSGLNAAVFWGGWLPPLNVAPFTLIPGVLWFIIKVMMGIFLYTWLRATLPRLRYDALMALGWKRMLPLALVWLFVLAGANLALERRASSAPLPTPEAGAIVPRMRSTGGPASITGQPPASAEPGPQTPVPGSMEAPASNGAP